MIRVVNRSETSQILPQTKKPAIDVPPGGDPVDVDIPADHPAVAAKVNANLIEVTEIDEPQAETEAAKPDADKADKGSKAARGAKPETEATPPAA